jgi:hypothetical protein
MKTAFESYWDRIIVINLERRTDRWAHFLNEMMNIGVTSFERFYGYDKPAYSSPVPSGNEGCTASHRGVLEIIAFNKWRRVLVLEDDVEVIVRDFNATWEAVEPRIPVEWDMLYLGGHYGEDPIARVNANVLRCGCMLTTSSYGITWQMARRMAPAICGIGPIDSLYGGFHRKNRCLITQPRFFAQYTNVSDLQDREMNNRMCMTDRRHEATMRTDYVGDLKDYVPPPQHLSAGRLYKGNQ